jgi:4-hydroxy-3-polyprenylbenzoate decarboxylase
MKMIYHSLSECVNDLERQGHLVRIKEEIDPNLEMAALHLRVHEMGGPALLFENVKGSPFAAVSNLFGTMDRARFMFRSTLEATERVLAMRLDPSAVLKHPFRYAGTGFKALRALPKKTGSLPVLANKTTIGQLPQVKCWPKDGGSFITLPQVYTEDPSSPGVMRSNLGMYRIQMNGGDYIQDKEVGMHYQIHRGIGVHQAKAKGPLKVSIFVGGPPAHTLAAVMPLPEGISELTFAGLLSGYRFRYAYVNNDFISADADFVITGEIHPGENKPEGPFGDHLGYYSLAHPFPVMKVTKVYHRNGAIWPFTVVGRPPQEDSIFGKLIHELTGEHIPAEIPGVKAVEAVDAAGVHPLLLAIGSERYTPYEQTKAPAELLTQANHILGTGQLSLAKYLFIADGKENKELDVSKTGEFIQHILERADLTRDLHFQTKTTIDTLDYSGTALNEGSKLIIAVTGKPIRKLGTQVPQLNLPEAFGKIHLCMPGVLVISIADNGLRTTDNRASHLAQALSQQLEKIFTEENAFPLIVLADDAEFTAKNLRNFLWVTFTRTNPSHDVHGVNEFTEHKHWGCKGPLIFDARKKHFHAPALEQDPKVEEACNRFFSKGGSLFGRV